MGDGCLILPAEVIKVIPPSQGVSWASRDKKLSVECKYMGFVLTL